MSNERSGGDSLRRILFGAAIVVVAAAGLYLGGIARHTATPLPTKDVTLEPPSLLAEGRSFPDVPLVGLDGAAVSSRALLGTTGGVVMFLELGCHPCSLMTARWDRAARDGSLKDIPVYCVTFAPIDRIRRYAEANGLTLPVYSDSAARFEKGFGVSSFPLRLVVDRSMTVRAVTYDSEEPVEPERLLTLMFPGEP